MILCAAAHAQTAVVERKTTLRRDPSAEHSPIAYLLPEDKLTVLRSAASPHYLKVRTAEGKTGWVWKAAVEVMEPEAPLKAAGAKTPAGNISTGWAKPAPVSTAFRGSEGSCPAQGDGGDTATNLRKNRTDELPAPHDVDWAAIATLPYPAANPWRLRWTPAQLAQIQPYEGVALRTVGYLTQDVKVESSGKGESTNCHFSQPEDVDWHIYLVEHPKDPIAKAVIVETTPRVRGSHSWDAKVLRRWVNQDLPVRISGFLMLDPEHRDMVGSARATVWEIHPVTTIEVCRSVSCESGGWLDLDNVK